MKRVFVTKMPTPIELIEFDPDDVPAGVEFVPERPEDGVYRVFNKLHASWILVTRGDMLNANDLDDVFSIARVVFEKTYRPVDAPVSA